MTPESAIFSRNGLLLRRDVYTSAPEYTAGDNIDITNHVISGRDWTDIIESAVSSIPQPDLSNYYEKNETSSKEELSAAFDNCCSGCVPYSGERNIDITDHVVSVTGRKTLKIKRPLTIDQDTSSFTIGIDSASLPVGDKNVMSASFVLGGPDNSKVTNVQYSVIRPAHSVTGYNVNVANENGIARDFSLMPRVDDAGVLTYNSGSFGLTSLPKVTDITLRMDIDTMTSVDLEDYSQYTKVSVITPYLYDGEDQGLTSYPLLINGDEVLALQSGCYYDFAKAQTEGKEIRWVACNSGYYWWL